MSLRTDLVAACLLLLLTAAAVAAPPPALDEEARRSLLVAARGAMSRFVGAPPPPEPDPSRLRAWTAGVFVTLEVDGRVRGCRGTLEPVMPSLVEEVRRNAVAAATHDPRFAPLRRAELARARISITVVTDLQPLRGVDGLAFDEGLVVRCGDRVGVVLPYEGRDPRTRLAWGCQKAGVTAHDATDLYKMRAIRFAEEVRR